MSGGRRGNSDLGAGRGPGFWRLLSACLPAGRPRRSFTSRATCRLPTGQAGASSVRAASCGESIVVPISCCPCFMGWQSSVIRSTLRVSTSSIVFSSRCAITFGFGAAGAPLTPEDKSARIEAWCGEQGAPQAGKRLVAEIFQRIEAPVDHPNMTRFVPDFGKRGRPVMALSAHPFAEARMNPAFFPT